ncbi:hypothetical protein L1987_70840 [Smallanthus sonchifolius]|uniref:Uncharacterized protein n=1 Tax=Smallanthus sonchifolius TaxID=185202 RepID=A0ACB9APY0_9ASTR|nr:hypothetical protein L1987_70840 [Smallanthus sonchifolius]
MNLRSFEKADKDESPPFQKNQHYKLPSHLLHDSDQFPLQNPNSISHKFLTTGIAVALVDLIKSKEPGSQIDLELLTQLLCNPGTHLKYTDNVLYFIKKIGFYLLHIKLDE